MRQVWKYEMPNPGRSLSVDMPTPARFLHTEIKDNAIYLWAEVDVDADVESRTFTCIGTGWDIPDGYRHVGTVMDDAAFVWHVYVDAPRSVRSAQISG